MDRPRMSTLRFGVIGGSGFAAGFGEMRWETLSTPYGEARVGFADLSPSVELVFLPRHGPGHRVPPHRINHRANIDALRALGVEAVVATAAVGSLREDYAPGSFVVLDDFIDLTRGPVTTFFEEIGNVTHTDFSAPFDGGLRDLLMGTYAGMPTLHKKGTYLCLSGPRYETPAEVRLFAQWGADVVGMTVAPEAILAREAALPYAAVAIVTNFGCGLVTGLPLSHAEVEAAMADARRTLMDWLLRAAITAPPGRS